MGCCATKRSSMDSDLSERLTAPMQENRSRGLSNSSRSQSQFVKTGYLRKEGHKFKTWKRRYFQLTQSMLSYHSKPNDPALGTIDIDCVIDVVCMRNTDRALHEFRLDCARRVVSEGGMNFSASANFSSSTKLIKGVGVGGGGGGGPSASSSSCSSSSGAADDPQQHQQFEYWPLLIRCESDAELQGWIRALRFVMRTSDHSIHKELPKTGYLMKEGHVVKNLKKRHFKLTQTHLSYSKASTEPPLGIIPLRSITSVYTTIVADDGSTGSSSCSSSSSSGSSAARLKNTSAPPGSPTPGCGPVGAQARPVPYTSGFCLETESGWTLLMRATSAVERGEWIRAINATRRRSVLVGGTIEEDTRAHQAAAARGRSEYSSVHEGGSAILEPRHMAQLVAQMPVECRDGHEPELLYSLLVHGASLHTFYTCVRRKGPTLLVLRTGDGEVLGAFCSASWAPRSRFFGTGESFLFSLQQNVKDAARAQWRRAEERQRHEQQRHEQQGGEAQAASDGDGDGDGDGDANAPSRSEQLRLPLPPVWFGDDDGMSVFKWRPGRGNEYFQFASEDCIGLGGGGGGFGLSLNEDFSCGTSAASATFANVPLHKPDPAAGSGSGGSGGGGGGGGSTGDATAAGGALRGAVGGAASQPRPQLSSHEDSASPRTSTSTSPSFSCVALEAWGFVFNRKSWEEPPSLTTPEVIARPGKRKPKKGDGEETKTKEKAPKKEEGDASR